MRQRTLSTNDGYSSSSSTSPTSRQRAFDQRRASHHQNRPQTRNSRSEEDATISGSIGKLVRLALFALVLALVVPYLRTRLFGTTTAVLPKNATVDVSVGKNPYHVQQQSNAYSSGDDEGEVDVFNFKHEDYLAPSARAAKPKFAGGAVAKSSAAGVVATKARSKKQETKRKATATNKSQPRPSQHDHDDDDDADHRSAGASLLSTLSHLLFATYHLLRATLYLILIPFTHLFRLTRTLISTSYHYFRLSLSHTLLPISHLLAPLTYLISGVFFVFIQTPFNLVSAIVTELYPVYIFLGAATVVGISMGVVAAGVLYLSAFVFVDRVKTVDGGARLERIKAPGGHGKGKGRMVEEEDDEDVFGGLRTSAESNDGTPPYGGRGNGGYEQYGYQGQHHARREYFNQPHSSERLNTSYASPMVSPTTPFRSSTARRHGGRNDHHGYSAASPTASTLRASG